MRDVIERNAKGVADWMNDPNIKVGYTKTLQEDYVQSIGFGAKKGDTYKNDLKTAIVVLKKGQNSFEVFTSYPIYK